MSPPQPTVALNVGIASSSVRVNAPGGTESDASATLADPESDVDDPDSDPDPWSPVLHVGALASGLTSMGKLPVNGAVSVGRWMLTASVVDPAAPAVTMKSNVG
jgi:hypothetical protein